LGNHQELKAIKSVVARQVVALELKR